MLYIRTSSFSVTRNQRLSEHQGQGRLLCGVVLIKMGPGSNVEFIVPMKLSLRFLRRYRVGITREGKNRWEGRTPLIPSHINELNVEVMVQPCTKRAFSDMEFKKAGAIISEDLSSCDLILSVKEIPVKEIIPGKTHMCFSHTHKGQVHNMPILQGFLDKKAKLIDYELLTDNNNKRLVAFGSFAGYAGFINALHGLGNRLLGFGLRTPFVNISLAHHYIDLADAKRAIAAVGDQLKCFQFHESISPLVFIFTGNGNVSQGAQEMFKLLPHQFLKPSDLPHLSHKHTDNIVYGCVIEPADYLVDSNGQFDLEQFQHNPKTFQSLFHERIAPYATVIINGIYWEKRFPRLLSKIELKDMIVSGKSRLVSVADISCDIHGSMEFTEKATTIDDPFFYYDAVNDKVHLKPTTNRDLQIMSIDNLPAQFPRDASEHFSTCLSPIIHKLVKGEDGSVIERATICQDGKLSSSHAPLTSNLKSRKRVLILGSGYVVPPALKYLSSLPGVHVTVASNTNTDKLVARYGTQSTIGTVLDVQDKSKLLELVSKHDIVLSFLPATMHVTVAEACIECSKHLVTASYVSPEMKDLNQRASNRNVLLLNELGLDPGLDHLEAMRMIDQIKASGDSIESFVSWCGGLPAPQHADNPLGYKFSWSPRGVLLAALNDARFLRKGQVHMHTLNIFFVLVTHCTWKGTA